MSNTEDHEIEIGIDQIKIETDSPQKAPASNLQHKRPRQVSPSPVTMDSALRDKCVNTIRVLAADVVEHANSGHPGAAMGCAPMAFILWKKVMNYNPSNPEWLGRDRFVLSNGHACALQYTLLHLTGYSLRVEDLKTFRKLGSLCPGHPENYLTPGVEVTTGPLGQGLANAVGLAIAQEHLAAIFNKPDFPIFDNYTYVICGDGCLQEGVSGEACSMAGHMGLGRLIVLYDDNNITIDGDTDLSFTENVIQRYESYGWHTISVDQGTDLLELEGAIAAAKAETDRPTLIKVKTLIGHGSAHAGTAKVHGGPLGDADIKQMKKRFGFNPEESFSVPPDVADAFSECASEGRCKEAAWNTMFENYAVSYPELASEIERRFNNQLPDNFREVFPRYTPADKGLATRKHSEIALNAVAPAVPELIGGSADLTPSNLTWLKCSSNFSKTNPEGRYMRYGIREHGMAAVANGMCAYGGVRPYTATFLNFIGYALGAVRLSALSQLGVLYIMTHDSIGLGEDGPTHQPVETIDGLRAIPNLNVFRPADGNETMGAYACALEASRTPSVLCLSRQSVPNLEGSDMNKVALGGYVVRDVEETPDIILAATGSEVGLCATVAEENPEIKIRVVSLPCFELFDKQTLAYQLSVFPEGVPVFSVEAGSIQGWKKYSHVQWGMKRFGESASSKSCMEAFGFTVSNITEQMKIVLEYFKENCPAPSLLKMPRLEMPC